MCQLLGKVAEEGEKEVLISLRNKTRKRKEREEKRKKKRERPTTWHADCMPEKRIKHNLPAEINITMASPTEGTGERVKAL